ncbi:MAG: alanine racemase [Anaerolineae bacterium]|nr:alanine racemase [Anaerolineae bacterium]
MRSECRLMNIQKPTAVLNPEIARRNIHRMAEKARQNGVRFRPHFKTPQSARIGEWFREEGVQAITVSSVDMACYFAEHGWQDITIAFPVNWLQIEQINSLAQKISLTLLVESVETVEFLQQHLTAPVQIDLKIDTGYHRTGLEWDNLSEIQQVAEAVTGKMTLKGLLTHAGHTYKARGAEAVRGIYHETLTRLQGVREKLPFPVELSIGDTPSCSLVDDLSGVDEIRPGNFVFYDWMQVVIGSCQPEAIAVAVACPVVAKHPSRSTIVIYGGAVHFSKDSVPGAEGRPSFGVLAEKTDSGWGSVIPDAYLLALSQEHGIVKAPPELMNRVEVGDVLMVLPIHSCLTVDLLKKYVTPDGEEISMMR